MSGRVTVGFTTVTARPDDGTGRVQHDRSDGYVGRALRLLGHAERGPHRLVVAMVGRA
jgi:hypothetical protein